MMFSISTKQIQQFSLIIGAVLLGLSAVYTPIILSVVIIGLLLLIAISTSPLPVFALMLILAPLRTLIATESAIQLPLDIGQLLFVIFAIIWWWHRAIKSKQPLSIIVTPLFIAIAAFTIAVGLTVFSARSMPFWLTEWLKWVTILVIMVIVTDIGKARKWELIVWALIAAGVANALVGIYIFFGGSGADHLLINGRFFRAFGTFGQPNPFGGFLGILLPIAMMSAYAYLMQLWNQWRTNRRIEVLLLAKLGYASMSAGIILIGIIVSWSRGAWLGLIVAVGVMAFCLPRKLWQSISLSASALLLIGAMWFGGLIPSAIQQRVLSSTEELFSFSDVRGVDITTVNYAIVERLAHWQAAMNMVRDNPWLGVGLGNYEVAYHEYRLINWEFPLGHAHNYYLNILSEAGIIGFLFYMIMWLVIIITTWVVRSHPDILIRSLSVGMMGSWAYLAFHSLLDNLYVNNMFLHLGVMLGLLAIFYQQLQNSISRGHYVSSNKRYKQ